jgi:A/G-specific adenine glycosylase
VASFAFGDRHVLLDTNVRRVLARLVGGRELPPTGATTAPERSRAAELLPGPPLVAASWNAAVMELGALVCTARSPDCARCPVATSCAWRLAGSPRSLGPPRRAQGYAGTDRQVRGRLLAVLREADGPVGAAAMEAAWAQTEQRARALDGLVADGLVQALGDGTYRFPG